MNPTDAAFAAAKENQKPSEAFQFSVVEKGFDMVKAHLHQMKIMPEFRAFATVEGTREKLNDPTIDTSALDRWLEILDDSTDACCLGHRVETLSEIGKQCLITATMCEGSDCDDAETHAFLRYFSEGIRTALVYMEGQLSVAMRN